jgi:CubicO group peptidase (beta-lactamase class C family)
MPLNNERLNHLRSVIEADVRSGLYFGAVIRAGQAGQIELEACIGAADEQGHETLQAESVFSLFSMSKAFTNVLILVVELI